MHEGGLTMGATKTRPRCDQTTGWSALEKHFESTGRRLDLREAFRADAGRFEALSQQAPYVFADLSKNLLDTQSQALLLDIARANPNVVIRRVEVPDWDSPVAAQHLLSHGA